MRSDSPQIDFMSLLSLFESNWLIARSSPKILNLCTVQTLSLDFVLLAFYYKHKKTALLLLLFYHISVRILPHGNVYSTRPISVSQLCMYECCESEFLTCSWCYHFLFWLNCQLATTAVTAALSWTISVWMCGTQQGVWQTLSSNGIRTLLKQGVQRTSTVSKEWMQRYSVSHIRMYFPCIVIYTRILYVCGILEQRTLTLKWNHLSWIVSSWFFDWDISFFTWRKSIE